MKRKTTAKALVSLAVVSAFVLTGCAPSGGGAGGGGDTAPVSQADIDKAMDTDTTLTFWTWVPDVQKEVDLFEAKYPKIKVDVVNVGTGTAQYPKLRTALKAGE